MTGDEIKKLREKKGWTQNQLAIRLKTSTRSIRRWENGDASPKGEMQRKLEQILKADTFISEEDTKADTLEKADIQEDTSTGQADIFCSKADTFNSEADTSEEDTSKSGHFKADTPDEEADTSQKADTSKKTPSPKGDISQYNPAYIVSVLEFLGHREASGVTEVRIFPKDRYLFINNKREYVGNVVSGYYDDYEKLARDISPFDGKGNIYITINPCKPELLARAANRLQFAAKTTTSDDDILCDLWFVYDCDPNRPADISATEEELQAALSKRDQIAEFLSEWAPTIKGMSGNGGHGLIHLPGNPNNAETRQTKERLTKFLHDKFTDWELNAQGNPILDDKGAKIKCEDGVSVDNTVFNMSRIWKLYGTMAVKGDDVPDRPHRRSCLDIPKVIPEPIDLYALLGGIIPQESAQAQETIKAKRSESNSRTKDTSRDREYPLLDVPAYLNASGVTWRKKEQSDRTWYQFETCPIHTDDDGHKWECGICQYSDGKMGAKCMHEKNYTWQNFKEVLGDPKPFYEGLAKRDSTEYYDKNGGTGKAPKSKEKYGSILKTIDDQMANTDELSSIEQSELIQDVLEKIAELKRSDQDRYITLLSETFGITQKALRNDLGTMIERSIDSPYFRNYTFIPKRLADEIMEEHTFFYATGQLYVYVDGVYTPTGEVFIKQKCREKLGEEARVNRVNEVIAHISDMTYVEPAELNTHVNLINFQNGMFNWIEGKILPHDHDYLSTIRIPIKYNPEANCPTVDYFLESTLPSDCIPIAEELFGYALIPYVRFEKAFMLTGIGANGKSTFLTLLERFIGDGNVSKVPLQELDENRFKRAELFGKLMNLFADLDVRALKSSSYFKTVVSGDTIDAERKHRDPFFFRPFARLAYSANQLPQSYDKTFAYYRRWCIIPFPNRFEGAQADKSLADKLTEPNELSGLLNRALKGLNRLFKNEYFTESETVKLALEDYKKQNDTVVAFINDCCTFDPNAEIERGELYAAYTIYCENEGFEKTNRRSCYDKMRAYLQIGEKGDGKKRYFTGIEVPQS